MCSVTTEVAVMNQSGVALAADSAVALQRDRGPKIFSSADKIFALSIYEPVGIMVYGAATILQVPWETIIKVYRRQLGARAFPELEGYAADFIRFLETNDFLFPPDQKRFFVYKATRDTYVQVREAIKAAVDAATSAGPVSVPYARDLALTEIRRQHEAAIAMPDRGGLPKNIRTRLSHTYASDIAQARNDVFGADTFTPAAEKQLRQLAYCRFLKDPVDGIDADSGIVIAGFGHEDVFPSLLSYELTGLVLDHAVLWPKGGHAITHFNHAFIKGFGQSDMVHLFMEGVTLEYEAFVESYVRRIVERIGDVVIAKLPARAVTPAIRTALHVDQEQLLADTHDEFARRRAELYVGPVLSTVASLPKDELGALAESLVNLTSLKRRISMEDETVGGPIDVAVLTKGDRLVWIRRKHYFDARLNHLFFANYFRDSSDADSS
jgi:hypothetical protein